MHKEKSAFPQSPGIRARSDYIISAHTAEVNQYTTISQELEHLQGWGLHITQHSHLMRQPCNSSYLAVIMKVSHLHAWIPHTFPILVHHLRNICLTHLGIWSCGWSCSTTNSLGIVGESGIRVGGIVTELRRAGE